MKDRFAKFARVASDAAGSPYAFVGACTVIVAWAVSGLFFGATDTWQLVINTGTTIITFLMVFLVQGATNRSEKAIQIKLNELLCAIDQADNRLIDLEEASEQEVLEARERVIANKPSL